MQKKKFTFVVVLVIAFSTFFCLSSILVSASSVVLKQGMRSSSVTTLQKNLKTLGYFSVIPTGYYGSVTVSSVKKLQQSNGLVVDGIAGNATFMLIDKLLGKSQTTASTVSRGGTDRNSYLMPWFGGAEKAFGIGDTAIVYDTDSGLSFKVRRSYGYNHSDAETLSANDTAIMKRIFGGEWSWQRRAIIVTVNGKRIAASMAGMPHAGNESKPANTYVNWRSGGFGAGTNLDMVKGNGMDGHFDIHFYGSKTHGTNRVDEAHQSMVRKAADWAARNY